MSEKNPVRKNSSRSHIERDAETLVTAYLSMAAIDVLHPRTTMSMFLTRVLIRMAKDHDYCKRVVSRFMDKIADED